MSDIDFNALIGKKLTATLKTPVLTGTIHKAPTSVGGSMFFVAESGEHIGLDKIETVEQ